MKGRMFAALMSALLMHNTGYSMIVNDLYEATLSSESQAEGSRDTEAAAGLKQVFLKVSGDQDALSSPVLKKALENPRPYLQQYATQSDGVHFIFNRAEVDQILKQAGIAVWGNNRPVVLLWVVVETEQGRQLLGSESDEALTQGLQKVAKENGVPLLLPLLDLEDVTTVTVTDVWGGFTDTLQKASSRYGSDTFLIGRMSQTSTAEWEAQWQLNIGKKQWQWQNQAADMQSLLTAGVTSGVPHIASYYAVAEDEEGQQALIVEISGIQDLKEYARVQSYLEGLDPVKSVFVHQIAPGSMVFKVLPYGQNGLTAVQQAITLDPQMTRLASIADETGTKGIDLKVKWIP